MKKIVSMLVGALLTLPLTTQASHCDGSTFTLTNNTNQTAVVKEVYSSALFSANGYLFELYKGTKIAPGQTVFGVAYSKIGSYANSEGHVKLDIDGTALDIKYKFYTYGPFGYFNCHAKATFTPDAKFPFTYTANETVGKPADLTIFIG